MTTATEHDATIPASAHPRALDLNADVFTTARVVVVDDEPANVELLDRVLRSVGVPEVHGLTDPREVVARCLEVEADLLLLDLRMPHRDGFEVLAELTAALPADAFLPVIVLTADQATSVRDRALHAGAADFVTKPFDRTEVLLRVRNILRTRALHLATRRRNAELQGALDERLARERHDAEQCRLRQARIDIVLATRSFSTVFQPVVDLDAGTLVGLEALTRFTAEPRRPPDTWFSEAGQVGRGTDLEVAAVLGALGHLDQLPRDVYLAMNVSPDVAIGIELERALATAPPERIVLELTEHTRIDDYHGLLAGLAPLRSRGFRIAVDDAGAGYAGLHHMLALQPDVLKLDVELIRGIDADPAKRALGTALVAFARETGANIVAEGIETRAELDTLRRLGIDWGQGYYLARPAPLPAPDVPFDA